MRPASRPVRPVRRADIDGLQGGAHFRRGEKSPLLEGSRPIGRDRQGRSRFRRRPASPRWDSGPFHASGPARARARKPGRRRRSSRGRRRSFRPSSAGRRSAPPGIHRKACPRSSLRSSPGRHSPSCCISRSVPGAKRGARDVLSRSRTSASVIWTGSPGACSGAGEHEIFIIRKPGGVLKEIPDGDLPAVLGKIGKNVGQSAFIAEACRPGRAA